MKSPAGFVCEMLYNVKSYLSSSMSGILLQMLVLFTQDFHQIFRHEVRFLLATIIPLQIFHCK